MAKLGWKYAGVLAGTTVFFMNFIACGSQLYQVSVKEDYDERSALRANPEVNQPGSPTYGIHSMYGWRKLPIPYRFDRAMNDMQRQEFEAAIGTWEKAVGKTLFKFAGDASVSGDDFRDLYSSLDDDENGHYIDENWAKNSKPNYVLATTIWNNSPDYSAIVKADIRFNSEHYVIGDSLVIKATDTKEVVDMQSLALHEIGHLLGLAHVDEEVDRLSIMNPSLLIGEGLTSRELSRGDYERIQSIYSCYGEACDIDAMLEKSGTETASNYSTIQSH